MVRTISIANAIAKSVVVVPGHDLGFVSQRKVRNRSIHFFFDLFNQARHGKLRLISTRRIGFAVPGNELMSHPAEHVVDDRGSVSDSRILGEAGRFKALVGEFLDERFERDSILECHARERADAIHQSADGGAFLGHRDKQLTRLTIFE